ncbi:hypothetical protein F01_570059 [Burkholderia cenocepacia]|nr:hypothetical protein F01_570059 [Burkholderia cenocepacia]
MAEDKPVDSDARPWETPVEREESAVVALVDRLAIETTLLAMPVESEDAAASVDVDRAAIAPTFAFVARWAA